MTDTGIIAEPHPELALAAPTPGLPVNWVTTPPAAGEVIASEATNISYTMGNKIGEGHFGLVYRLRGTRAKANWKCGIWVTLHPNSRA
jgi:hypothetical protein